MSAFHGLSAGNTVQVPFVDGRVVVVVAGLVVVVVAGAAVVVVAGRVVVVFDGFFSVGNVMRARTASKRGGSSCDCATA
jgi:hypothetical protein